MFIIVLFLLLIILLLYPIFIISGRCSRLEEEKEIEKILNYDIYDKIQQ